VTPALVEEEHIPAERVPSARSGTHLTKQEYTLIRSNSARLTARSLSRRLSRRR
jgi:hypothetical protein